MPVDPIAYMSGAMPSGSWVPGGNANGASLSDRESAAGAGSSAASGGGLHVNPLIGRGAEEIHQSGAMGMMSPLMMGRMAAFGGTSGGGGTMAGMGAGQRTRSQPNLYIPTTTRSQAQTLAPAHSASQYQGHSPAHSPSHGGQSLAQRHMAATANSPRSPGSPLAQQSFVAPRRGSGSREAGDYFQPVHPSPMSPSHARRSRVSHSVPNTPVTNGWMAESAAIEDHRAAPTEYATTTMSYDPPSTHSRESRSRGRTRDDGILRYPGGQDRAQARHARSRSRDGAGLGLGQGPKSDPDEWESHSGSPRRISPEPAYYKISSPVRDKADSLPSPQAPTNKVYDDRRNHSHQPRPPSALRTESVRPLGGKVVRIDSIPEGRVTKQSDAVTGAGDSVPLPLARGSRPGLPRRHTSHPQQSPLPSPSQAEVPGPSPSSHSHMRGRGAGIPRSMSHDALDMYGLADELPVLSPRRSPSIPASQQAAQARRTGHIPPLTEDEYDPYVPHPAAASPSSPVYAFKGSDSGSLYTESRRIHPPRSVAPSAARHLVPAGSMSTTMTASPAAPQTPTDLPLMGSDYTPLGFPKPTTPLAWNREGPTMKAPGIPWHRDTSPDTPLSPAPAGPSWQQARPPNYGPIVPDRAASHSSGWWEAASRV